jgi:hypothetical protein
MLHHHYYYYYYYYYYERGRREEKKRYIYIIQENVKLFFYITKTTELCILACMHYTQDEKKILLGSNMHILENNKNNINRETKIVSTQKVNIWL